MFAAAVRIIRCKESAVNDIIQLTADQRRTLNVSIGETFFLDAPTSGSRRIRGTVRVQAAPSAAVKYRNQRGAALVFANHVGEVDLRLVAACVVAGKAKRCPLRSRLKPKASVPRKPDPADLDWLTALTVPEANTPAAWRVSTATSAWRDAAGATHDLPVLPVFVQDAKGREIGNPLVTKRLLAGLVPVGGA
jgi:hypothetical protein